MSAFKEMAKQRVKPDEIDVTKCYANGCPCRATTQLEQGRWMCTYHAFAPSDRWTTITRALRDHDWLWAFIGDIQKMDTACEDWRGFASQFWQGSDRFCMPDPIESASAYGYRMRGELAHRIGVSTKRPDVRRPQPSKVRGVFHGATVDDFERLTA